MNGWSAHQLDAIGSADELLMTAPRSAVSPAEAVPIWVVRVGDALYVRSFRGASARWYRRVTAAGGAHITAGGVMGDVAVVAADPSHTPAIDSEYRRKYGRYGAAYIDPMTAPAALETTLELRPR